LEHKLNNYTSVAFEWNMSDHEFNNFSDTSINARVQEHVFGVRLNVALGAGLFN
jgi:hypothetical protein